MREGYVTNDWQAARKVGYRRGRVHRVGYEGITVCGLWFRRPFSSVSDDWLPMHRVVGVTCKNCRRSTKETK